MGSNIRRRSTSGIYHVMLRGVNKQRIFNEKSDYRKFLEFMGEKAGEHEVTLYAYCLMTNHVHVLAGVSQEGELPSAFIGDFSRKYAMRFNKKYDRVGHLFQGRYRSEPVEDEAYFVTVVRYIHQNPVKAGLCEKESTYPWSSYLDVVGSRSNGLVHADAVEKIVPDLRVFSENCSDQDAQKLIAEYDPSVPANTFESGPGRPKQCFDDSAFVLLEELCGATSKEEFLKLPKADIIDAIANLTGRGISLRQLESITGLSRSTLSRYINSNR